MIVLKRLTQGLLHYLWLSLSVLVLWILIGKIFHPAPWLLPPPSAVWQRFLELVQSGNLGVHLRLTVLEILLGYLLGVCSGFAIGYPISQIKWLEKLVTPYLIAGNSIPLIAFAPLLLLWLGNGLMTKIVITGLIVFLPMTISTITGFRAQNPILVRLLNTLRSTKWQRFIYLEVPAAMPGILSGMKIGAPLAVVGAVIAEFLGSAEGLGHLILEANGLMDTSQLFVANILLAFLGIFFFSLVQLFEAIVLGKWEHRRQAR